MADNYFGRIYNSSPATESSFIDFNHRLPSSCTTSWLDDFELNFSTEMRQSVTEFVQKLDEYLINIKKSKTHAEAMERRFLALQYIENWRIENVAKIDHIVEQATDHLLNTFKSVGVLGSLHNQVTKCIDRTTSEALNEIRQSLKRERKTVDISPNQSQHHRSKSRESTHSRRTKSMDVLNREQIVSSDTLRDRQTLPADSSHSFSDHSFEKQDSHNQTRQNDAVDHFISTYQIKCETNQHLAYNNIDPYSSTFLSNSPDQKLSSQLKVVDNSKHFNEILSFNENNMFHYPRSPLVNNSFNRILSSETVMNEQEDKRYSLVSVGESSSLVNHHETQRDAQDDLENQIPIITSPASDEYNRTRESRVRYHLIRRPTLFVHYLPNYNNKQDDQHYDDAVDHRLKKIEVHFNHVNNSQKNTIIDLDYFTAEDVLVPFNDHKNRKKFDFSLYNPDFKYDIIDYDNSNDIPMVYCDYGYLVCCFRSQQPAELLIYNIYNHYLCGIIKLNDLIIKDLLYLKWNSKCLIIIHNKLIQFNCRTLNRETVEFSDVNEEKFIYYSCGTVDHEQKYLYLVGGRSYNEQILRKYDEYFQPIEQWIIYSQVDNVHWTQSVNCICYDPISSRIALIIEQVPVLTRLSSTKKDENLSKLKVVSEDHQLQQTATSHLYVYESNIKHILYKIVIEDNVRRQWVCPDGQGGWLLKGTHPMSSYSINAGGIMDVRYFDCESLQNILLFKDDMDKNDHDYSKRFIVRTNNQIYVLVKCLQIK
ncbi:unnamed protein product [Didymodactylos carnosus]|uniref:Uncharacterized protein n=1 Tax=Didymodactylos carnosus TaxID=1234261 RepID=A0A814BJ44_9BILA|nr:unnamed protein product [Didymodactylos carnosus]CAF0929129.1 unnamed protein product [Didymodactylos carnosus]CAF3676317.1 unnamed protein product [Didymodactylos carnosus]CAF3707463.1 unnamed protein product [Didymodactylos carnosus]